MDAGGGKEVDEAIEGWPRESRGVFSTESKWCRVVCSTVAAATAATVAAIRTDGVRLLLLLLQVLGKKMKASGLPLIMMAGIQAEVMAQTLKLPGRWGGMG